MLPRDRAREAYGGVTMSDIFDGTEDGETAIRAAVQYLLKESSGSDGGDVVREIIEIVMEAARCLAPGGQDPRDDGLPDPFDDAPGG
jgi:hypothetical protein